MTDALSCERSDCPYTVGCPFAGCHLVATTQPAARTEIAVHADIHAAIEDPQLEELGDGPAAKLLAELADILTGRDYFDHAAMRLLVVIG